MYSPTHTNRRNSVNDECSFQEVSYENENDVPPKCYQLAKTKTISIQIVTSYKNENDFQNLEVSYFHKKM